MIYDRIITDCKHQNKMYVLILNHSFLRDLLALVSSGDTLSISSISGKSLIVRRLGPAVVWTGDSTCAIFRNSHPSSKVVGDDAADC